MKTIVAFAAVLFAVSSVFAETPVAAPVQSTVTKPGATPPVPVVKAPVKKDEKPKVEKEPIIPGTNIARANGTFLGLEVVGTKFKLSFYDKKKKPMSVDVTGGLMRWPNVRGPGDNRSPLIANGTALLSVKPVLPPFAFNVFITLLQGEGDNAKAVESYTIFLRG